jgi:hypothetical protein
MKPTRLLLLAVCLQSPFVVANENPPAPDSSSRNPPADSFNQAALQELAGRAEKELRGNILPFWLKHTRDPERGGFYGLIDGDMTVHQDEPRGALLTSRILWTFSTAYRVYRDPEYLAMARWAYRDLADKFTDQEFGGLYWTITAGGKPRDTRKQIYGQVFGLYALAEYYRATGEKPALDQAIAIYRLVEKMRMTACTAATSTRSTKSGSGTIPATCSAGRPSRRIPTSTSSRRTPTCSAPGPMRNCAPTSATSSRSC